MIFYKWALLHRVNVQSVCHLVGLAFEAGGMVGVIRGGDAEWFSHQDKTVYITFLPSVHTVKQLIMEMYTADFFIVNVLQM